MREYLLGVLGASALVSLATLLVRGRETERVCRFALGLLLLASLLLPLRGALTELPDLLLPEETAGGGEGGLYAEVGEDAFAEGILAAVEKEFSVPRSQMSVRVIGFDFASMRAERIVLLLRLRGAHADPARIEKYITEAGLGECEVELEIG